MVGLLEELVFDGYIGNVWVGGWKVFGHLRPPYFFQRNPGGGAVPCILVYSAAFLPKGYLRTSVRVWFDILVGLWFACILGCFGKYSGGLEDAHTLQELLLNENCVLSSWNKEKMDKLSVLLVWCQNYEKLGHLCGCTVGCILWALVLIPYHLQTWCWFVIRELDLLFPFWSTDENGLKGERSGLPFIFAVIWFIVVIERLAVFSLSGVLSWRIEFSLGFGYIASSSSACIPLDICPMLSEVFRVSSKVYMLSTCLSSYTLGEMVSDKEFCPSFLISWNFAKLLGILVGCPVLFECCYYSFFLAVSILWSTVVDLVLFVYPLFLALNVWFMCETAAKGEMIISLRFYFIHLLVMVDIAYLSSAFEHLLLSIYMA
ncbi:hypothetical protein M9H77_17297 [Catharanthus roseus]|uniref:Uncharacterized protein n=1 Tax=Catharanthus roseus TaxID=4058 RepID=A0ACC0B465_CATRO|nr:hypothetical protein M9H77_17297 [Catharanthus roseus]